MEKIIGFVFINLIIFIACRFIILIFGFLIGMGAADHYKYESYLYLPLTVLQLFILIYLYIRKKKLDKNQRIDQIKYLITFALLIFLSVAGFFNLIPSRFVPF